MEELLKAQPLTLALVALVLLLGGDRIVAKVRSSRNGNGVASHGGLGQIAVELANLALRISEMQRQLADYTEQVETVARLEVEAKGLAARCGKMDLELERVRDRIDKVEEVGGRTEVLLRSPH